jgi:hypothetical protein
MTTALTLDSSRATRLLRTGVKNGPLKSLVSTLWTSLCDWKRRAGAAIDLDGSHGEQAYLAAAVDVYDLERRLRELDRRRSLPVTMRAG